MFNNYSNKTMTHQIQKGDCMMEMRKFIVELHTDGSMTWNEYSEPGEIGYADVARKCRQRAAWLTEPAPGPISEGYVSGLRTAYIVVARYCEDRIK